MNDKNIVGLGLDDAEVAKRVAQGLTNKTIANKTKSIRQIIKDNCVTFFNILNLKGY